MKNILEISAAELHTAYLSTFNTNINRMDPAHLALRIHAWLEGLKTGASLRGVMPIQNGVKTFNGRLTSILRGLMGADGLSLGNFMALIFEQIPEDFSFVGPEKLPNSHEIKYTIRIQNLKNGRLECVGEFDSRAEAGVIMLDYPEDDEIMYRVVEIGSEDADC